MGKKFPFLHPFKMHLKKNVFLNPFYMHFSKMHF
jgi:hypothetical protein